MQWEMLSRSAPPSSTTPIDIFVGLMDDVGDDQIVSLAGEEQARATRLLTPELAQRFIASRVFCRRALAWLTGANSHELVFRATSYGKPYISGIDYELHFNLAHSGRFFIMAVSRSMSVGIDIEATTTNFPVEGVDLVFSSHELRSLERSKNFHLAFLCGWTRKEAVLKCMGFGLYHDPRFIQVSFDVSQQMTYAWSLPDGNPNRQRRRYSVFQPPPIEGAIVAVATAAPVESFRFWRL